MKESVSEPPLWKRLVCGGLSCMIPLPFLNPFEVIKIRLQIQGELDAREREISSFRKIYGKDRHYRGLLRGALAIIKEEKLKGLYKGFTPALLREASYSAIRMGLYDPMKALYGEKRGQGDLPLWKKILAGSTAGSIGGAIATPTDLIKVRMQAEGKLQPGQSPRYRNTAHAFYSIVKHEGFLGLYKGIVPNTIRACLLSGAMLPSYDHSKHFLLRRKWVKQDGFLAHFLAAMIAGFLMTLVTSPVDVIKTRIMNQATLGNSYTSVRDCVFKTIQTEGWFGLYKGFLPSYMRQGPHSLMALMLFEQLRKIAGIAPV